MRRVSSYAARVAGITLAAGLTGYFAYFLQGFSYLPGTDAYYYALQARSLLEHGHLKVPDHGIIHYAVAAVASLGISIETAFRTILTVVFALYQLGMAALFSRVREHCGPIAVVLWVFASPLIVFHTVEFPGLTLGLATLPLWFWLAMERTRRRIIALVALLAFSLLVHPAAAALVLLFVVTVAGRSFQSWGTSIAKLTLQRFALVGVACLACLLVAAIRFAGLGLRLVSMRAGPPGLLGLMRTTDTPVEIRLTVAAMFLLLLLLLVACAKTYPRSWLFLSVAALALPLWPDRFAGLESMGGRLSTMFVLLALPLLVVVGNELAEMHGFPSWTRATWMRRSVALAAVMAIALFPVRVQHCRQLLMTDDYPAYEKVITALHDLPIAILIAHRGLDFFYSYRLGRDAFHFDPEPDWNQAEIWRVAGHVTAEELAYYSPPPCAWGRTAKIIPHTHYFLVREDCWEGFRLQVMRSDNPDLYTEVWENAENPSQARPAFLRARQRLQAAPISRETPR